MSGQHFSALSRRSFLQTSTAASAALALRIVTEPMLAYARWPAYPTDAVLINSNENPLGPCVAAREAVVAMTPQSGRYLDHLTDELIEQYAQSDDVRERNAAAAEGRKPVWTGR